MSKIFAFRFSILELEYRKAKDENQPKLLLLIKHDFISTAIKHDRQHARNSRKNEFKARST